VLDVDGLSADELAKIPLVLQFLEERVRPDLLARGEISKSTEQWWHFRRPSLGLRAASRLGRLIAVAQTSNAYGFIFTPGTSILSHKAIGFHSDRYAVFALLQSRVHQVWALFHGSTMKDDPVYAPEDCFETFPFPSGIESNCALEQVGRDYYEFRSELMRREHMGLTEVYNWFHDPECQCPDIPKLRELHDAIDRTVLDAYGWTEIPTHCELISEFGDEEDEDEDERSRPRRRKFRWPDDVRDDVLARLLILNQQRGAAEALEAKTKKKRPKHAATPLFDSGGEE
jgi:hypothetical protein